MQVAPPPPPFSNACSTSPTTAPFFPADPNGARMIRNVEKLLADAHRSRLVSLTDFLAYVQTLRDVGLREGEAPADSSNAGAVQLMTVHKAKGLEFPLTVLADAAHEHHAHSAQSPTRRYPPPRPARRRLPLHRLATRRPPRRRPRRSRRRPPALRRRHPRQRKTPHQRTRQTEKRRHALSHRLALEISLFWKMSTPEHSLLENGIYSCRSIPTPKPTNLRTPST